MRRLAVILLVAGLAGCPSESKKKDAPDAGPQFARLEVTDAAEHLLFTYLLADGSFQSVNQVAEVPEEAREQVVVIDTRLSPEERQSSKVIYVADLSAKREDGSYPCRPVSRFKFERDLLREPGKTSGVLPPECEGLAESPGDHVIIYSTSWCGVCKATARFLQKEKIPYVEKDVEKDKQAQQEMACKALKTGTRVNGVPVIDIAGTLLLGFDRDDILRLSRKLKKSAPKDP